MDQFDVINQEASGRKLKRLSVVGCGMGDTWTARLKSKRLKGTGKDLRHVKMPDQGEIDEKELSRLLLDAAMITAKGS